MIGGAQAIAERAGWKGGSTVRSSAIAVLGVAIWGTTLLWPEVNTVVTAPVTVTLAMGAAVLLSLALVAERLGRRHGDGVFRNGVCCGNASDRPCQPLPR